MRERRELFNYHVIEDRRGNLPNFERTIGLPIGVPDQTDGRYSQPKTNLGFKNKNSI